MEDITIRAIKTLFSVDIIACEDTRRTGLLLQELKNRFQCVIPEDDTEPKLLRLDDRTESKRTPEIIELLEQGKSVALISDAGTPMLSDPGFYLIHECIKRNIPVIPIPGASALLTGIVASGLPSNQLLFLGFPPEKQSSRQKLFADIKLLKTTTPTLKPTIVFYVAPHKLFETLRDLEMVFPRLAVSIARELTKIHETVWQGSLSDALKNETLAKGEITLLFTV